MDTPGSELPSESTDTSTANTSSATSPIQHINSASPNGLSTSLNNAPTIENDDSASDVSMSADSDNEDEDTQDKVAPQSSATEQPPKEINGFVPPSIHSEPSRKRKFTDPLENSSNGPSDPGVLEEVRKRLRPDETYSLWRSEGHLPLNRSLLPAEIWHHIFTFTPPRTLGNLLQVNKSFNQYLDPSSDSSITPLLKSAVPLLKPDAIWRASRRLFKHPMPVPLVGKTELDMWRLACANSCQFCGKKKPLNAPAQVDQWHPGPGENGVIPVWLFAVRSCGSCLVKNSLKEYDLLMSPSVPSLLIPALPFIFITNELHVLPSTALQNGQPPSTCQFTKYYSKQHIDTIKGEFDTVKVMGSATVDEWLKGLEDRGREQRKDATRWERWDASGGVMRMQRLEPHEEQNQRLPASPSNTNTLPLQGQPVATNGLSNNPRSTTHPLPQVPKSLPAINTSFLNPPPRYDSPSQSVFSAYTPRSQQPKHERTKEEVAELKAARRADIERRCLALDPPLTANILAHMSSFQAAIQIIQPLNDGSWEVLKPRLLSQREEAEQREKDRIAQTRVVQERSEERRFQDAHVKSEFKETLEREWDDVQAPLRARIGGYADETIRDGWNGGDKVTKESSPRFAAEVLIYVRKRFYAEVAKDDAAVRATGREPPTDPPMGPFTRKLTLENMKWVFDTKIKPHTEQYSKELFLCNACENNFKYYGFEGVIQHFAAKHTSALSVGSIVVHWKSEWPEYPPFNPDPNAATKNTYYPTVPSASTTYPNSSIPPNYGYGGYQQPVSGSFPMPSPNVYQESPASYYGQYGDQYSAPPPGSYPPPQMYQDPVHGYSQYSAAPPSAVTSSYDPYAQTGYGGPYPSSSQAGYVAPHNNQVYASTVPEGSVQQTSYGLQGAQQYGSSYSQPTMYTNGSYPQPATPLMPDRQQTQQPQQPPKSDIIQKPQHNEEYKAQLRDLGRDAKAIWNSMSAVKEVPGSVKVYTIIHHILKAFRAKFQQDPSLSMIVEGLSNNKDMRPVRNINGLLCRACVLGLAGSATLKPDKKHFSFPQLVSHFRSVHEEGLPSNFIGYVPDWTKDMVELPDQSKLTSVTRAPGMDEKTLALFSEALPQIIAPPQSRKPSSIQQPVAWESRMDSASHNGSPWQSMAYADEEANGNLAPSQDNHTKYYATTVERQTVDKDRPAYGSDEYESYKPYDMRGRGPRTPLDASLNSRNTAIDYDDKDHRQPSILKAATPVSYTRTGTGNEHYMALDRAPRHGAERIRYQDMDGSEHKPRYERSIKTYDDMQPAPPTREYRAINTRSHQSNGCDVKHEVPTSPQGSRYRPLEDATSQQNKIFEVVAQISRQAQQVRDKVPVKQEADKLASGNGNIHESSGIQPSQSRPSDEASNAAERFLNTFLPESPTVALPVEQTQRRNDSEVPRPRMPASPLEPQRRPREIYTDDIDQPPRSAQALGQQEALNGYYVERVAQPRHYQTYAPDDRYTEAVRRPSVAREASPDAADRRYRSSNVVYRDERQGSRAPSRYSRYESVRLENDRARSRSPVYVKMRGQAEQHVEHSPAGPLPRQEPIYRTRTPDEIIYERAPRQEYYRVYADEPRPRPAYEYVQYDSQGPYIIQRQVRREPGTVYATYDDEPYTRQPVYESRPAVSRTDPAYYEEYDPRHPAPLPPAAAGREVRYQ
ncbi:F-box domain containing protein [Rutstroemia sp. NJR-2017a WRK4]|nr:F-box domain containing protein [Rutstroemia sp. NJR-2017a WRK4]